MDELAFVSSVFVGSLAIGWSFGFKWLTFKKGVEAVASNN